MTYRILDYLNFSNAKNPDADSGLISQISLIRYIIQKYDDCFFYFVVPKELEFYVRNKLPRERVYIAPLSYMCRQNGGIYHFDIQALNRALDLRKIEIDVLFVNQPEVIPHFLYYFNKVHFYDLRVVGYVHWMDWWKKGRVKNRWNVPANLSLLSGIFLSDFCGCNSEYAKKKILAEADNFFNNEAVAEIESKLQPLYVGADVCEINQNSSKKKFTKKTIIFPFRTLNYTGLNRLLKSLNALWRRRKDFQLLLTNPNRVGYAKKYPFVTVQSFNRDEYLQKLSASDIVIGCHEGANGWSIGLIEAICARCIPLVRNAYFLPELMQVNRLKGKLDISRYMYDESDFLPKLNYILDNLQVETERAEPMFAFFSDFYDWRNLSLKWYKQIKTVSSSSPTIKPHTSATKKIQKLISSSDKCAKERILKSLNWHTKSRYIAWTQYRNYLRTYFDEDITNAEVLYFKRRHRN